VVDLGTNSRSNSRFFGINAPTRKLTPSQIAARIVQAGHKAECDRVSTGDKNDWDRVGRGLRRLRRSDATSRCNDHPNLAVKQFGSQRRQLIVMAERPAVLDVDVLPFDKASLIQPSIERGHIGYRIGGRADSGRGMADAAIPLMRSRRRFAFLKDYRSALTVAYRNAITAGIYDRRNGVLQSSNPEPLDVRFGSIADIVVG